MKRKIPLTEKLSVGFVRLSAFFTLAMLCVILGYILWNGFFYNNRYEYQVTSRVDSSLDGATLVVNKDIKLSELPYDLMRNLFTDEYSNWKKLDKQDIDLFPYIADELKSSAPKILAVADPAAAAVPAASVSPSPAAKALPSMGSLVEYPGSTRDTVRAVADQAGSVALVDSSAFSALDESLRGKVKVVHLRTFSLAVNPDVTAIKDNHRVSTIDEKNISALYSGGIANWKQLDGSDLPVVMILPPDGDPLAAVVKSAAKGSRVPEKNVHSGKVASAGTVDAPTTGPRSCAFVTASSMDEYYRLIATTPGAAGLAPANRAVAAGLPIVKLARQESGRNLSLAFILDAPKESGKIGGISTIILNTFVMIFLTLLFAIPPGLFAAIYLVEYAREGTLVRLIRLGTETLAGIPSIIFGLFGMLVFVQGFGWGISLLSGSLTVTLMILPTIVRTAEEALKSIPRSLQEGSLALGATKVQTIFRVVLPAAFPAIASGIILAIGRALGETAALLYTMGSNYNLTSGLFDSTRTLAVHIYLIIAEGISTDRAFASAAILVMFILVINTSARFLIGRMGRMARA